MIDLGDLGDSVAYTRRVAAGIAYLAILAICSGIVIRRRSISHDWQ